MKIDASTMDYRLLNQLIKESDSNIEIDECFGQRYIASGLESEKTITIQGVPGNALGSYLDGAKIIVNGNVQDAVGDTMNNGEIIVHGNAGDALGYSMRGGAIYVKGDCGYRTGIHMKQYLDKEPIIVVGGKSGSFLGEYLAGGLIIILGLNCEEFPVGYFPGAGMHGGRIFIRSAETPSYFPTQLSLEIATQEDIHSILEYITIFSNTFNIDKNEILNETFYKVTPNTKNPYKQLYTYN